MLARVSVLLTNHLGVVVWQGPQFLLLTRFLGVDEFRRAAAITALVTVPSRCFKVGTQGGHGTYALAKRLPRYAPPYGMAVGTALYILAPWLPWIQGESYRGAIAALQVLCFRPTIHSVQYVFSDALTGAGFQKLRTQLQFIALAICTALGWVLIPSMDGPAWCPNRCRLC